MSDRVRRKPLWDGASVVAKRSGKRDEFIAAVQAARKPLGRMVGREWHVVRRQRSAGFHLPFST